MPPLTRGGYVLGESWRLGNFSVVFIPASWAEENSYRTSLLYDEDGYNTECAWKERQPDSSFRDVLTEILPVSESWHKDLFDLG